MVMVMVVVKKVPFCASALVCTKLLSKLYLFVCLFDPLMQILEITLLIITGERLTKISRREDDVYFLKNMLIWRKCRKFVKNTRFSFVLCWINLIPFTKALIVPESTHSKP